MHALLLNAEDNGSAGIVASGGDVMAPVEAVLESGWHSKIVFVVERGDEDGLACLVHPGVLGRGQERRVVDSAKAGSVHCVQVAPLVAEKQVQEVEKRDRHQLLAERIDMTAICSVVSFRPAAQRF